MPLAPPPSAQEFSEEALPRPRWLVDKLLPGDGWTLLVARPKTGKSLLAMQLAAAMQDRGTFLGRAVVRPGSVLYIQMDAPPGDWQDQVRKLPEGRREWATYTRAHLPMYVLDPTNSAAQAQLRQVIASGGFSLVILDALEKLTKEDINTKEGCQKFLERLRHVSPGPTLVIHHPRKPHGDTDNFIDSAAGHHYLTGDASAIWGLKKNDSGGGTLLVTTRGTEDQKVPLARLPNGLWGLAAEKKAPEFKPIAGWGAKL